MSDLTPLEWLRRAERSSIRLRGDTETLRRLRRQLSWEREKDRESWDHMIFKLSEGSLTIINAQRALETIEEIPS